MSPLFKKLNLKNQSEILVLNAPESFQAELHSLQDVNVHRDAKKLKDVSFCIAFVTKLAEVERAAKQIARIAGGDPIVWIAYPKASSKNYTCEFNRDTGWKALGDAGFEGVRQVAIDEDWSALRFRRAEFIKSMTRDKKRAISRKGKSKAAKK